VVTEPSALKAPQGVGEDIMSRLALLGSTIFTFGYAYVVGSAMAADRATTIARVSAAADKAEAAGHTVDANRLWYGGTLPAITVYGRSIHLLHSVRAPADCRPARAV
jgi:hypothetical protein